MSSKILSSFPRIFFFLLTIYSLNVHTRWRLIPVFFHLFKSASSSHARSTSCLFTTASIKSELDRLTHQHRRNLVKVSASNTKFPSISFPSQLSHFLWRLCNSTTPQNRHSWYHRNVYCILENPTYHKQLSLETGCPVQIPKILCIWPVAPIIQMIDSSLCAVLLSRQGKF